MCPKAAEKGVERVVRYMSEIVGNRALCEKLCLQRRIKQPLLRRWVYWAILAFTVFMVVARLVSGVHWLTDIIGGILLSAGLVMLYRYNT